MLRLILIYALICMPLIGCAPATKVALSNNTIATDYQELYLIKPYNDPADIFPEVIKEFQDMGFRVKVVEPNAIIEGIQGTGFLVSKEGFVITSAYVVEGERVATLWHHGARYLADVVVENDELDIALLKIRMWDKPNIRPVSFHSSSNIKIGDGVYAIAVPANYLLGSSAQLLSGMVSVSKGILGESEKIQISVLAKPGFSGAPVFTREGVVSGMSQTSRHAWSHLSKKGELLPVFNYNVLKSEAILKFIFMNTNGLYSELLLNQHAEFDSIESAIFKIRAGSVPVGMEDKPRLIAWMKYKRMWDLWYKFRYFIISLYDFDSKQILFRAGKDRPVDFATQEAVFKDTFAKTRKLLNR